MGKRRSGSSSKRPRRKSFDHLSRVWAVTGCTCGHTTKWNTEIAMCWRCVIANLPEAQWTKKNRKADRALYRKLVRAHGKKSPILVNKMRAENENQIHESLKRRAQ